MEETAKTYRHYLDYVLNLLDEDSVFEDFESPVSFMSKELADKTNQFILCMDKSKLSQYVYNINSVFIIKYMLDMANNKYHLNVALTQIRTFINLYMDIIDQAEYLSNEINYKPEDILLYGFAYSHYLLDTDKKSEVKFYKKEFIKPLFKVFKKEYLTASKSILAQ